jgi:hypothetical protein
MAPLLRTLLEAGVPKTELFGLIMVVLLVVAFGAAAYVGWRAEHRAASRRSATSPVAESREAGFHALESQSV